MATTSLWAIRTTSSKSAKAVVKQLVEYAENEQKTRQDRGPQAESKQRVLSSPSGDQGTVQSVLNYMSDKNEGMRYVSGINCNPETAVEEMITTRTRWTQRGNRVVYHGYQSFQPGEGTPEQIHRIGVEMARQLWGDRFEVVVATHLDRAHLHNHFLINAVSFLDGKKFVWDTEFPRMQKCSDEICKREGLSVLDETSVKDKTRARGMIRAETEGRPTLLSILKEDIDSCISVSSTVEEWMELMEMKGYRFDASGKYLKVFPYGHKKAIRIERRFGEEYSLQGIEEQIRNRSLVDSVVEMSEEDEVRQMYRQLVEDEEMKHDNLEGKDVSQMGGKDVAFYPVPRQPVQEALTLRGIQVTYLGFLVKIGFRATKGRIARTHYLLREELTKLDRYIEESKFLIREGIQTEAELRSRQESDRTESMRIGREYINCKRKLDRLDETAGGDFGDRRENLRQRLDVLKLRQMKVKDDLKNEKNILQRMGEMRRKLDKVEEIRKKEARGEYRDTERLIRRERSGSNGLRRENS